MQEDYNKALKLSKNHKRRSTVESKELYAIIKKAVEIVQKTDSEKALAFLVDIYMPFISTLSYRILKRVSSVAELEDVKQEVIWNFITLVRKYDPARAEFSYYIYKTLPQYIRRWIKNEVKYQNTTFPFTNNADGAILDTILSTPNSVIDYLNSLIINEEFILFMLEQAKKKTRSKANYEICMNLFLGRETCADIAMKLNISYHAVYQKMIGIKEELKIFFNENPYSDLMITSTGIREKPYKFKIIEKEIDED